MGKRIGIVCNGLTGRVGLNQHLTNSLSVLRRDGLQTDSGDRVFPDILLVGRSEEKLEKIASEFGIERWTTDLSAALAKPEYSVYFDSTVTKARFQNVSAALEAGKHVFCEKPLAQTLIDAGTLSSIADNQKLKTGVVMSHLWLPGIRKLKSLIDAGFFGDILSVKADFGYWVHTGASVKAQRPSWNYRSEDGGGMVMDLMCHWHYILEHLFGSPAKVLCLSKTLLKQRWDESGIPYQATADDMAFAIVELNSGVPVQLAMSWGTRVRRDDLLVIQVDGSNGSAVAGVRDCYVQSDVDTPTDTWNPERLDSSEFSERWTKLQSDIAYDNPFLAQWKRFLNHVLEGTEFPWSFSSGTRGVAFIDACCGSASEHRWVSL